MFIYRNNNNKILSGYRLWISEMKDSTVLRKNKEELETLCYKP